MADIVERLRGLARAEHDDLSIGDEAADEIERLGRVNGALVEALGKIEGGWVDDIPEEDSEACVVALQDIARAALALAKGEKT